MLEAIFSACVIILFFGGVLAVIGFPVSTTWLFFAGTGVLAAAIAMQIFGLLGKFFK